MCVGVSLKGEFNRNTSISTSDDTQMTGHQRFLCVRDLFMCLFENPKWKPDNKGIKVWLLSGIQALIALSLSHLPRLPWRRPLCGIPTAGGARVKTIARKNH